MQAIRIEKSITQEGTLVLNELPFHVGEEVEIIVLPRKKEQKNQDRYPLRGKPLRYDEPFEPVAEDDWKIFSNSK